MNLGHFSACYLDSFSFPTWFCGLTSCNFSTLWSVSSALSDRSYKCTGTICVDCKACGVGKPHLARGSLMKEETALSRGSWHADRCAVSMALRWCIIFPFKSFLSLLNNTRDRIRNVDSWKSGKGMFFSNTIFQSSAALLTKPCWQFLQRPPVFHQPLLCHGLTEAAALHISCKCLWNCNISPRHALSAQPCIVLCHQACSVLTFTWGCRQP